MCQFVCLIELFTDWFFRRGGVLYAYLLPSPPFLRRFFMVPITSKLGGVMWVAVYYKYSKHSPPISFFTITTYKSWELFGTPPNAENVGPEARRGEVLGGHTRVSKSIYDGEVEAWWECRTQHVGRTKAITWVENTWIWN